MARKHRIQVVLEVFGPIRVDWDRFRDFDFSTFRTGLSQPFFSKFGPGKPESGTRKTRLGTWKIGPRQMECDPRQMEYDPRQMEYDPRQMEYDPRQMEYGPRQMEYDPRQMEYVFSSDRLPFPSHFGSEKDGNSTDANPDLNVNFSRSVGVDSLKSPMVEIFKLRSKQAN